MAEQTGPLKLLFKDIAHSIRQKDGSTGLIHANDFPARILTISTGGGAGGFAVPLTVTVDPGAVVTAVNGSEAVSVTAGEEGVVLLTLTAPGLWTVTGTLGDVEKSTTVEVAQGYNAKFSLTSRLPEGYIVVDYISNPNLGYIQAAGIPENITGHTIDMQADFSESGSGAVMGNAYDYRRRSTATGSAKYSCTQAVTYFSKYNSELSLYMKQNFIFNQTSQPSSSLLNYNVFTLPSESGVVNQIHADFPNQLFRVNQEEIETIEYTWKSTQYPFALFARNRYYADFGASASTTYGMNPLNFKLYSLRVTENATGELVNDFVPCKNPEGLAGLYDLVKEAFYSSTVAAKPFVAGPEI